ncbi:protein tesmin/TSO1-like CXC 2 [Pyrus ussuriensis x Pyrus communis]|uniref:Protein tesmin/TSO1-like CXC 2 n=1 Tax=Pyrus ussuriensis x Pyrus communis TaxID=2448454 RepID=A0A5N5HKW7_9ROSA|nr:protein tesmin/TSO1-like CXC 2 [Pyrus ussuriensis x Pyrus communis]
MSETAINPRDGKAEEELLRFTFEKVEESRTNTDLVSGAQNCGKTAAKVVIYDELNVSGQSYEYSKVRTNKKSTGYLNTPEQHVNNKNIPLCGSRHLMLVDLEADPCDAGMSPSQDTDSINKLNQLSHKRKRNKEAYTSEACKRCNCRRSKCVKLYCECFSAGVYCLDSYACQNCYNKPEFEHTVFEIHHHIESRNPLAFTSKVVDNAIDSSANSTEDQNLTTPSSAGHKRGCNCKKSKCLEKYCERYQAKVGCFGGCRLYNGAKRWEPHPTAKLAASNFPCVLSSAGAHHDMTDDDTPEILGETSYPSKVVKVSSPNKKRLTSGRNFILHAVPSFPPLTPYHTSKEGTSEIGNDDGATNKNNWYEARFGRFSELVMDNLLTAYSIVQNNWTKLLIGFQLPQIRPKTTSVLPEVR